MRRALRATVAAVAAVAAGLLLAGCGSDGGEKPDFSGSEKPVLWNPCHTLDPEWIKREFGVATTEETGTATAPECRFRPKLDGDPVITAEYRLFIGSLEDAWETMRQPEEAVVSTPDIAGADDARLVVNESKKQLSVTGFVEDGDLIQIVNLVDPSPYDAQRDERGVRRLLGLLSEQAQESGVSDSKSRPSGH
jgi:hypothetical protein